MFRATFIAKLAGAFALGHVFRFEPQQAAATYRYEHFPEEEPRFIIRRTERPSAVEAQSFLDAGLTHCAYKDGGWWVERPLRAFVTPVEEVRL